MVVQIGMELYMTGIGTIVNSLAVLVGGSLGVLFNKNLKEKYQEILLQALGISVIFVGLTGSLSGLFYVEGSVIKTKDIMLLILSLAIGSLFGELIGIEKGIENVGEKIKKKFSKGGENDTFIEGFVSATLLVCVGAMAVVGSFEDGLKGDPTMLFTKSILDFASIMVIASALGKGAVFSAFPMFLYQGSLTLLAKIVAPLLTDAIVGSLSTVGSALIFAIGINMCFGKKFRVGNMLPSLLVVLIYYGGKALFGHFFS
ncbi:MAG TPA: DUF554 domain-containing protein [Clostridiales bacterium]|jgi:uncharacterized membrane protein YqgA involved in biofilm formation|nr:DUF554 domain-containing protein [Clostridiales bacterium]HOL79047.1 DUF554 domain-containing protein [Clostridiales bacterium]HPP68244.1 DUF554 domain-containing protein [Clostridiales bacterium]HPU67493.1 DUF554 domain-containing protein [Clostridiales bacterium]HQA05896.1 DUF554 domain-containing protein [Clostridiales bacterium]